MRRSDGGRVGRAAIALGWALAAATIASGAEALELDALLRGMASSPGVHARFTETRTLALLQEPLVSEGEIFFVPPRRFARLTTSPGETRFVVDGDRLVFSDATGEQRLSTAGTQLAREVVDNFIVLFSGDAEGLHARYETEFSSEGERWRLVLTPRASTLGAVIARVTLSGEGPLLLELVLEEPGGDRSVTRYRDVRIGALSAEEAERAFRSDGR